MRINFSKREKVIFVLTIIVLFVYAGMEVAEVFSSRWQRLRAEIRSAEEDLALKTRLLNEKTRRVSAQRELLEVYRQKDSDERIRSNMLLSLQKLSTEQGIRITDMKPSAARTGNFYKEFPVSVMLEGSFLNMMRFLYQVESSEYGFEILELKFSQSYSAGEDLKCQIILSRLFLPPNISG